MATGMRNRVDEEIGSGRKAAGKSWSGPL